MEPFTMAIAAGAAIQGLSALYQAYEAAQARKATKQELDRIAAMIDKLEDPYFDPNDILPEEYAVVAQYVPEAVPFIQEVVPEKIKMQGEQAVKATQARSRALDQMMKVVESGEDPIAAIERERGARRAAQEAASARATLERDYSRMGQLGGGLQYAGALGAASDAMNRMALADEQAVANREIARRQAADQAGSLAGQIYDDEYRLEKANVDAINDFNRRMSQRAQELAYHNVGERNRAQMYNIGQAQRVADLNVGLANQRGDIRRALAQQKYQNALNKIGLKSKQGQANIDFINQGAASRAQTGKAIADAGSGALSTWAAQQKEDERFDRMYPKEHYRYYDYVDPYGGRRRIT